MKKIFFITQFNKEKTRYWISFFDLHEYFTQRNTLIDTFKYTRKALTLCIEKKFSNNNPTLKPTKSKNINDDNSNVAFLLCDKFTV